MDDDLDLRHFANRCCLFPLPRVVLFPHAVLPLHIFEPRYRQMTEDALAGDRLVTMVQLRPARAQTGEGLGVPPVETVGCLGRILQHERLPDGRFNFLLLGRKRVRLSREVTTGKLYRVAEMEIVEDQGDDVPEGPRHQELVALFRRLFNRQRPLPPELSALLENELPLGVLTDIMAHALGLPAELKQQLLGEAVVGRRAEVLRNVLASGLADRGADATGPPPFPPPFSPN